MKILQNIKLAKGLNLRGLQTALLFRHSTEFSLLLEERLLLFYYYYILTVEVGVFGLSLFFKESLILLDFRSDGILFSDRFLLSE